MITKLIMITIINTRLATPTNSITERDSESEVFEVDRTLEDVGFKVPVLLES